MKSSTPLPLSDQDFFDKYGAIGHRLIGRKLPLWGPDNSEPILIFNEKLAWPAIPIPGSILDLRPYSGGLTRTLETILLNGDSPLADISLDYVIRPYLEAVTRETVWKPIFEELKSSGPGVGVVFAAMNLIAPEDYDTMTRQSRKRFQRPSGVEFVLDVDQSVSPNDFDIGYGDDVCIIDTSGKWIINSWHQLQTCFLSAEPALMDRIVKVIGGTARLEKLFSLFLSMWDEYDVLPDGPIDFFRQPPFPGLKIRRVRTLDDHLAAHPWLDEIFKDW